jgi:hypothetical protein
MGTEASTPARTNEEQSSPAVASPGEAEFFNVGYHILGGIVQPASPFEMGSEYLEEESDVGGGTGEEENRPAVG